MDVTVRYGWTAPLASREVMTPTTRSGSWNICLGHLVLSHGNGGGKGRKDIPGPDDPCIFVRVCGMRERRGAEERRAVPVMAAAAAADKVLISTHLSDVYSSSQTDAISISTSKPHVPFPPQPSDDEPPPEHAQYASFFHSVQTGVILLRLIHNGLIVELVSLSTETPPIRFVFPYTVLPNPAVVLWETRELHILAVIASGSLYRLVLPLQTPQQLWSTHMVNNWCREYHLKYVPEYVQALVQVQGTHTVALALTNGSLIRLDAETIGDKTTAGPSMFLPFSIILFLLCIQRPLDREPVSSQHIPCIPHFLSSPRRY